MELLTLILLLRKDFCRDMAIGRIYFLLQMFSLVITPHADFRCHASFIVVWADDFY